MRRFRQRFFANRGAAVGLTIMLLVVAVAAGAPWLFPGDPLDAVARPLLPPFEDARWLFGTDRSGRDIAAGIAHGARISLMIGVTAAAGAILIGTVVGALAGFYRGWIDDALMRLTDAAQTVPNFLLALALIAVLGPATWSVILAIALVSWPGTARIVRAEFLSLREREFVLACRTMGMGDGRLIFGQMLPNVASSIVVLATVVVSIAILVESALSYLGLGDPNIVSWGGMIAAGRPVFRSAWTVSAIPGLAIVVTVLGVNLIGEALTDALNPRKHVPQKWVPVLRKGHASTKRSPR